MATSRKSEPHDDARTHDHSRDASAALIDALYRAHHENLVRYLRTRLANEAEAREAAQESYARLMTLDDVGKLSFPRAYLYRMAQNVVLDFRRRARVRTEWEAAQDRSRVQLADQETNIIARETLCAIRTVLEGLSAPCREAFRLSRDEGLGARDIALRLGVGERMVRYYLAFALSKIIEATVPSDGQ